LKIILIIVFVAWLLPVAFSQETAQRGDIFNSLQEKKPGEGTVKIHQDSSIAWLVRKYINYCETAKGFPGYRIRIFSDSGNNARDQATHAKTKFLDSHKDFDAYLQYNAPNFEIYVGDFRTKSEALKLLKTLQSEYPSAFIVKTLISGPNK
jgi:hypothetical protein